MKMITFFMVLAVSIPAYAQFSVTPFGSASPVPPPIGQNRKTGCGAGGCNLELTIKPYCYGTNLRAYPVQTQLNPSETVKMYFTIINPDDASKKDTFEIHFPANATYATGGVRADCSFNEGQNMNVAGYKDITCSLPNVGSFNYKLEDWLTSHNPRGYGGADFDRYAGSPMMAQRIGAGDVDSRIVCLYKFTSNDKHGQLKTNAVSCYFPSTLPDISNQIKLYKAGTEVTNAEIIASANNIKIKINDSLNSLSSKVAVRHGKITAPKPPGHHTSYVQGGRGLAAVRELESFDEASAYRSFTTQVKFPGSEGFCGGYYSPLMFFFDKQVPKFDGVSLFPLYGVKEGTRVNWPEKDAPGYFLAKLGKGETTITKNSQLFGQDDKHENGFLALGVYDKNKDGVIDAKDEVFNSLQLWNDKNGDGQSDASELQPLKSRGIASISLKYSTRDVTKFEDRARAREKSKFTYVENGKTKTGDVFDVWLAPLD
ncbi:hypothetical protein ACJVC5_15395 [Peredibacter sp. HCB2-198]|uniref:hypothetical protein n=1 Tax=Peredibacter sp. HCB2-198 TaxID=3383025 RepID=UPI0038B67A95